MAPAPARIGLAIGGLTVGSVEHGDARLIARTVPDATLDDECLDLRPRAGTGPTPAATVTARLERVARALRDAGRLGPWRDEALPVLADDDTVLGAIERAAVRPLGLRTLAVHLLGWRADDTMWAQRRAPGKAVDPGRLDTLAGGLVGMRDIHGHDRIEELADAMRREADEEAGVPAATAMRRIDSAPPRIARPVAEGYMVEDLVGFEAVIDAGFVPSNRDGEVAGFECLAPDALLERIARGEFTLEASLLILEWLDRGGRAGS